MQGVDHKDRRRLESGPRRNFRQFLLLSSFRGAPGKAGPLPAALFFSESQSAQLSLGVGDALGRLRWWLEIG